MTTRDGIRRWQLPQQQAWVLAVKQQQQSVLELFVLVLTTRLLKQLARLVMRCLVPKLVLLC